MSWHTPTHSSQMKTVGPAISFRTSFWLLLQNEHRRTSSLFFFTDSLFVCYGPSSSFKATPYFPAALFTSGCALSGLRFARLALRPACLRPPLRSARLRQHLAMRAETHIWQRF